MSCLAFRYQPLGEHWTEMHWMPETQLSMLQQWYISLLLVARSEEPTPVKDVMTDRFVGSALQNYKDMVEMVGCMLRLHEHSVRQSLV